jgi:hypothetical protein
VFFNLQRGNILKTKIAKHIKLPYVTDNVDIFNTKTRGREKTDFRYYNRTYNTMYYIKSLDSVTYFRPTNNLVTYERKVGEEVPIFVPDFFNTSYNLVQFNKLNIINKSENNLLVKNAKDKLYFVSLDIEWHDNKRYIAVIDIKSGKPLLMTGKDNEQLSDLLPILNRHVIPIFQAKEQSISIYLVDLSSDKVGFISWNMMNIRQLIIDVLRLGEISRESKKDIMEDQINYLNVDKAIYYFKERYDARYADSTNTSKKLYIRGIELHFGLLIIGEKYFYNLYNISIKIEVDSDKIVCYWDVGRFTLDIYKRAYDGQAVIHELYLKVKANGASESNRMLQRSYNLQDQTGYRYISTDLYENNCYHVRQNNEGIIVKEKSPYSTYENYYGSSLYRYDRYLVMIQRHNYSKLVFIDTQKNLLYKFIIHIKQHLCPRYRFTYHYYPLYETNKLLLLSKDLQCLIVVDMSKVEHFIETYKVEDCEKLGELMLMERYENIEKISVVLDVNKMIMESIYAIYRLVIESDSVKLLDHQVDKDTKSLYIFAKYSIQDVENIGVFKLNMLSNILQFKLYSFCVRHTDNPTLMLFYNKNNSFRFISNFDLYKISFDKQNLSNLDIYYYDPGFFISVKYNRVSCKVIKGYYKKNTVIVENLNNIIIMKYGPVATDDIEAREIEFSGYYYDSSYGLLVHDLVLVQKMRAILL